MKTTKQLARELGLLRKRSVNSQHCATKRSRKNNQIFSYLIVLDFESTCWEGRTTKPNEIIEFPAVLLNTDTGVVEHEFHYFVQPQENVILSKFCVSLTGITQTQVDNDGIPLFLCLRKFNQWITKITAEKNLTFQSGDNGERNYCTFVTWSDWDIGTCLFYECKRKQLRIPSAMNSWIDLRATYRQFYERRPNGLNGALQDLGIEFQGREHSGLDDSRNTAKLAWRMLCDGCIMKITKSLVGTTTYQQTRTTVNFSCAPSVQQQSVSDIKHVTAQSTINELDKSKPGIGKECLNISVYQERKGEIIHTGELSTARTQFKVECGPKDSLIVNQNANTQRNSLHFGKACGMLNGGNGVTTVAHKGCNSTVKLHDKVRGTFQKGSCKTPVSLYTVNRTNKLKSDDAKIGSLKTISQSGVSVTPSSMCSSTDVQKITPGSGKLNGFKTPSPLYLANRTVFPGGTSKFATPLMDSTNSSHMKVTSPLCNCGRRSQRKAVQSPGPNFGRGFFSCPLGRKSGYKNLTKTGCGYFKWESPTNFQKQSLWKSSSSCGGKKCVAPLIQPNFDTPDSGLGGINRTLGLRK